MSSRDVISIQFWSLPVKGKLASIPICQCCDIRMKMHYVPQKVELIEMLSLFLNWAMQDLD